MSVHAPAGPGAAAPAASGVGHSGLQQGGMAPETSAAQQQRGTHAAAPGTTTPENPPPGASLATGPPPRRHRHPRQRPNSWPVRLRRRGSATCRAGASREFRELSVLALHTFNCAMSSVLRCRVHLVCALVPPLWATSAHTQYPRTCQSEAGAGRAGRDHGLKLYAWRTPRLPESDLQASKPFNMSTDGR